MNERVGSTRIIRPVEPGIVAFEYTDKWSVFDRGASDQTIHAIGVNRVACAVKSFELAHGIGLPTHFVRRAGPFVIHVREFDVLDRDPLSGSTSGRILPLEWIWRTNVYGSLLERIQSGNIDPEELGFEPDAEIRAGTPLPQMIIECTTKFEEVDRHLTDEEARDLAEISNHQWEAAHRLVLSAVTVTNDHYEKCNFLSPDGKLELALTDNGEVIVVDVFGTQDENRIVSLGRSDMSFCKDLIRDHFKGLSWKAELDAAKKAFPRDKSKWPPYPELPEDLVKLVSSRYMAVAQAYAG